MYGRICAQVNLISEDALSRKIIQIDKILAVPSLPSAALPETRWKLVSTHFLLYFPRDKNNTTPPIDGNIAYTMMKAVNLKVQKQPVF